MDRGGILRVKRNTCLKVIYANGDISNWALRQLHTEVPTTWQQSSKNQKHLARSWQIYTCWTLPGQESRKEIKSDLLSKTALLSLLGAWGRTDNYRYSMITTSHPDDIPWTGEVSSKPTPHSEMTNVGYVFHDITWKQKVKSLATFLPLNMIGRTQERLQVARRLHALRLTRDPRRILRIQVDAVYVQVPKGRS